MVVYVRMNAALPSTNTHARTYIKRRRGCGAGAAVPMVHWNDARRRPRLRRWDVCTAFHYLDAKPTPHLDDC